MTIFDKINIIVTIIRDNQHGNNKLSDNCSKSLEMQCKINFEGIGNMSHEKKDEPKLNYEDFYKLTGRELTGKISHLSSYEIDAKLNEIIDELGDELNRSEEYEN